MVVLNFTPVPRQQYRIGVPEAGWYAERLNSDAAFYGGGNLGNGGGAATEPVAAHGFDQSLRLTIPPLACLILKKKLGYGFQAGPTRPARALASW